MAERGWGTRRGVFSAATVPVAPARATVPTGPGLSCPLNQCYCVPGGKGRW
jgi:hypothetical protein